MDTKPLTTKNIDYRERMQNSNLRTVFEVFTSEEVSEALYSSDSHMLNTKPKEGIVADYGDVNERRAFLVDLVNRLLKDIAPGRVMLREDYKFTTVSEEHVVTENDFKLWENNPNLPKLKSRYQEERFLLVVAMEQAITLMYQNQNLRFILNKLIAQVRDGKPLTPEEIADCRSAVLQSGLSIVDHDTSLGFRGSANNHGTLLFNDKTNSIELHLNSRASRSISELIHELGAYLLIKSSGRTVKSQEDLDKAKKDVLPYTLLCIDLLKSSRIDVREYVNL